MDVMQKSLQRHEQWKGKIEVVSRVPVGSKEDLTVAYTPGVAQPCLEIQKDIDKSYELTRRHNLCAVITDGTAVLGLGDIGPEAGMPVMEGKCVLFKSFGNVDAFPICIKSKDVETIVNTVYLISGSFGGINLEDISSPRCFEHGRAEHADVVVDLVGRVDPVQTFLPENGTVVFICHVCHFLAFREQSPIPSIDRNGGMVKSISPLRRPSAPDRPGS